MQIQCEDSWFLKQIRRLLVSIREGKAGDEVKMITARIVLNINNYFRKARKQGSPLLHTQIR